MSEVSVVAQDVWAKADVEWILFHGSPGGTESLLYSMKNCLYWAEQWNKHLQEKGITPDHTPQEALRGVIEKACEIKDRTNDWHFQTREHFEEVYQQAVKEYAEGFVGRVR